MQSCDHGKAKNGKKYHNNRKERDTMKLLDCIYRIPEITEKITENRKENFAPLIQYLGTDIETLDEILFVGSGTSNTSAVTACRFVEEVSGISAATILPNEFLSKVSYNPKALYVFTSQSGTSTLALECQKLVKDKGLRHVGLTANTENPMAKAVDVHVELGCGYEEYGMRTIGYNASVQTLMFMGMEIGLAKGYLSQFRYDELITEVKKVPASHKEICEKSLAWFDSNKGKLMAYESFAVYGSKANWGVALEGALKILEMAKRHLCVGYEMDDGLHGPTMGFTDKIGVIILSDGGKDDKMTMGLADFGKAEFNSAHIIGVHTRDGLDLPFEAKGGAFHALEFAATVQVLSYRLAIDYGIELVQTKDRDPNAKRYFNTHSGGL